MRNIIFAIFALFFSGQAMSQEIRYDRVDLQDNPDWGKVLKQAQRSGKVIFLDGYTSWCAPCKKMERDVFQRPRLASYFNQKFINVKYDMENGEGAELKSKYGVSVFPTYLFITGNGQVVHRIVGAHFEGDDFWNYAKMAVTPGKSYSELQQRYDNGERNSEMMFEYFQVLRLAGETNKEKEIVQQYLRLMSVDHFKDPAYWGIVKAFLKDPGSREFKILLANREEIGSAIGMEEVDGKIYEVLDEHLGILEDMSVADGDKLLEMLRSSDLPQRNLLLSRAMAAQHFRKGEYYEYASLVDHMMDFRLLAGHPDPLSEYDRHAALFEKHVVDEKLLRRAARWAEHAHEEEAGSEKKAAYLQTKYRLIQKIKAAESGE